MKKLIAVLMALMLALTGMSAFAAEGDAVIARSDNSDFNDYIDGSAVIGDTLYLKGSNGIYTYHVGDADVTLCPWAESWDYLNPQTVTPDWANKENGYLEVCAFFAYDGALYMLVNKTCYDENSNSYDGSILVQLVLDDTVTLVPAELKIDLGDMVEEYDNYSYVHYPNYITVAGGCLCMQDYDDNGSTVLRVLDLTTGKLETVENMENVIMITEYREDMLLMEEYDYAKPSEVRISSYDVASGAVELLLTVEVEQYNTLTGLTYSRETDTVYYWLKGMLHTLNLSDGTGVEVAELSTDVYGGAKILNGSYYVYTDYQGTFIRNLDPGQMSDTILRVNNSGYAQSVTNAYYTFSNTHPDVTAVVYNDYGDDTKILEAMMNREETPDIFVMDVERQAYSAIRARGYMADMNGSEKLTALIDSMYDGFKAEVIRDGDYVAIPVSVYGRAAGYYQEAMEKLGLTMEDMPANWNDLLDWMANDLPSIMEGHDDVSLLYSDSTADDVRNQLFYAIFSSYVCYLDYAGWDTGFDTPLLEGLLNKLDAIDFVALGALEESPYDEEYNYIGVYRETATLLETYSGATLGNMYGDATPVCLAMDADTPALLPVDIYVAFINPFTKNYDAAVEFMETIADNIDTSTMMNLTDTINEPVENQYYEQNVKDAQEWLDNTQEMYDNAAPEDKQDLEEQLGYAKENLEWAEKYRYDISPEDIEWYRENAKNLIVNQFNPLYSGENSDELYTAIEQYESREISAKEFLQAIDKKLQMMILEGM